MGRVLSAALGLWPKMQRGHKIASIAGITGLTLVLVAVFGFGPAVRSKAQSAAAKRGLHLRIDTVRPGSGRVWLRGVEVELPEVPAVKVELQAVEVQVSALMKARSVRVHGGKVHVTGSPEEVRRQLADYRASRAKGGSAGGTRRDVAIEGIDVVWNGLSPGAEPQHAWGVRYTRTDEGEDIAADLVRVAHEGLALSAAAAKVELDPKRKLRRLGAGSVLVALDTSKARG